MDNYFGLNERKCKQEQQQKLPATWKKDHSRGKCIHTYVGI